jgi:hypothetical protein
MAASAPPVAGHQRVQHYVPKAAWRVGRLSVTACGKYCWDVSDEAGKGTECTVSNRRSERHANELPDIGGRTTGGWRW